MKTLSRSLDSMCHHGYNHRRDTAISKKVVIVNSRILEPKGTLGMVIMSDNVPAKVTTVWPWHYDEPALYIMQGQC